MELARKKQVQKGLLGLLAVIGPAFITSYFSYQKSKVESGAGYQTLVEAVQHMQPAITENQKAIERLEGKVDVLQTYFKVAPTATITATPRLAGVHRLPAPVAAAPVAAAPPTVRFRPMNLPKTLENAVEQMQQRK